MNFTSWKKFYFHCLANSELKPHTKVLKNLFHDMALKILYVTTTLPSFFSRLGNLEALIQIRLKGYYNNTFNVRISLEGYGSKIRKVSRCTVSDETFLATQQEFFFTKVAPV